VETPKDCNDNKACTKDYCVGGVCKNDPMDSLCVSTDKCKQGQCVNGGCTFAPINCDDNIVCTYDFCDPAIGCTHTPVNDYCTPINNCHVACCDPKLGCVSTPKSCDDKNPCTEDTCASSGQCVNKIGNYCNDGLRCTDDICKPDPLDTSKHTCEYPADLSNCGIFPSCIQLDCGYYRDCTKKFYDHSSCPEHTFAPNCLKPDCTDSGCLFKDICGASHPDCNGCDACTCNKDLNKCVKACPSKRSLENELVDENENISMNGGGPFVSVSFINLFFYPLFNLHDQ